MILRELVAQGDLQGTTMAAEIATALTGTPIDRLDVAVAYATRSGLSALQAVAGGWPATTRWVVGLDDAITQPEAIDDLIQLAPAELRLARLASQGRRFHPKLYCFWASSDPSVCVTVIGSANMTFHGLNRNGEVGVILAAENAQEANQLKDSWNAMRALGEDVSVVDLAAYRIEHARSRTVRRRLQRIGALPEQPEADEPTSTFNGDPATASLAWTEGASPPAGGRDLEFPKPMMPFFGLAATPTTKRFRMGPGMPPLPLTFTRRAHNAMWRLMFSSEAIQAAIGRDTLRPLNGDNRSDLAIVFRRAQGLADYDVEMVVIGSAAHAQLIAQSQAVNGLRQTRNPGSRNYGFL